MRHRYDKWVGGIQVKIIAPLLVIVVGALFTYVLNKDAPDVRYILSDRIPISVLMPSKAAPENVQQLEIKNIGSAPAKKVQVLIHGNITAYHIAKLSEADSVQTFNRGQSFEAVYQELPVQGSFKLIFTSNGVITDSDLSIRHLTGKAKEALTKGKDPFYISVVFLVVSIVYMLLVLYEARKIAVEIRFQFKNARELLLQKKPWYIPEQKWDSIYSKELKDRIYKDHFYGAKLFDCGSYQLLSVDKPTHLDEVAWTTIVNQAIESLEKGYASIVSSWQKDWILELLAVKKPKQFPENKWRELEKKANEQFIFLVEQHAYSTESILVALKEKKPDLIQEYAWENHIKELQKSYKAHLAQDLDWASNPIEFLNNQDLAVLTSNDARDIEQRAYQLALSKLPDIFNHSNAQKFLDSEKPEWLKDADYQLHKKKAEESVKLSKVNEDAAQLKKDKLALKEEKNHVSKLKNKIEGQLNIIHSLLSDPVSLDRIESYCDDFAPENFRALKRLAELLKQEKET